MVIQKGLKMNRKARILGLIAIVLTLLAGCTDATLDLDSMEDTSAVEE